ncbi:MULTISPECIES: PHP domain-containing protein [unclassified Fusibacter]|uniref:PHP domain-containing protein n=1 Tax=unclassified Fusibacter TaxID=2624464 RepID=UPI00101142E6|nr:MULTISPECIES: PHP domain-containing protein [unclassified Fusibacter]MCK8061036.1 PHP domain-containing protein [Fusibacter sp. A2]NPE20510.1 PHP domain-containing protein [Fusibacter sp. A1]RXV63710.1 PHP domain-containing protein [Fusibacter sp. A1]
MKINGDYHTHTLFSHGVGRIEENVLAAIEKGFEVIAIAEHSYGHLTFGVKRDKLYQIKEEIDELNQKYPQIQIKFGLEANILNVEGDIDVDEELLRSLDFVMAGYHFGSVPKKVFRDTWHHVSNLLSKWIPGLRKACTKRNTVAMVNAMKRYPLFAVTHPGAKGPIDIDRVAQTAFEEGILLEINAHHGHLSVEEIRRAKAKHARFIINSDAHDPRHVGRVDKGIARAVEAGLTEDDVFNVNRLKKN